ncbi:MAG TPA: DNA-directed RNA polymerase subunit omega [Acidobacteriota bacterium]|nr:DNA-directed RNA polymerase subunit omega [Acidobacteriota bacterium]
MIFKIPDEFDSKFRFCVVAGKRATQIQAGARSELENGFDKPAYLAVREAEANLIRWRRTLVDENASQGE